MRATFALRPLRRFQLLIWQRGDCWEWRGCILAHGYGAFHWWAAQISAHRMAYELAKGSLPPGYQIDHLCRHRWCVRPSHLEAVTARVNTLRGDGPTAKNAAKIMCDLGHAFKTARSGKRYCPTCEDTRDRTLYWKMRYRQIKG